MDQEPDERKVSDFFGLPNGREDYAMYMLDYENKNKVGSSRYTEEETLELYRLDFDYSLLTRKHTEKEISDHDFSIGIENHNAAVREINNASYQRLVEAEEKTDKKE